MKRNILNSFFLLTLTILLSACASGARYEKMAVTADPSLSAPAKFANKITITSVSGGKDTNPLLMSKVDNKAFTEALKQSLGSNGYLADDKGRYVLDAELLGLEQPIVGFDLTVDSIVEYTLTDTQNNSVVFNDTIKSKGTATMGDSLLAVERLRMSNEFSVQNNIKTFINKLNGKEEPTS